MPPPAIRFKTLLIVTLLCTTVNFSSSMHELSKRLFLIFVKSKVGYIDKTGKIIVEPQYLDSWGFHEGLARVRTSDKWGYIDETGAMIIKEQFSLADDFSDGLARVEVDGKYGYIDKTGKLVITPQFDSDAWRFDEGLARVKIRGKYGYIDKTGN